LLDSGSAVNTLPYQLGLELGGIWDEQSFFIPLSGKLAGFKAKGLLIATRIGSFPAVNLAFAWAETDSIPVLLGQTNFFQEFDVCFFRSRSMFEVRPKQVSTSPNPD